MLTHEIEPSVVDDLDDVDDVVEVAVQDVEPGEDSASSEDEGTGTNPDGASDIIGAFFSDVASGTERLDRDDEQALAGEVVARRDAIVRLLQRQRRLVRAALSGAGRGVIHPEEDFREREALLVLQEAGEQVRSSPSEDARRRLETFVRKLKRALAEYRAVRDRMVTANIRLVIVVARRYRHPTLSFLDLVQEGTIGLLRAVEKFEPDRGIKFSTYAVWWIWQQIARASDCQGALIRTPVHWNQLRRKIARLADEEDDDASERLGVEKEIGSERFAAITRGMPCISLASPVGGDDERPLESILPASTEWQPESTTLERERAQQLAAALKELPEREATILRLRFGVDGDASETLDEIGTRFGVSRERVRQLEARALRQMRAICEREGLKALLH